MESNIVSASKEIQRFDSADAAAGGTVRPFAKAVRAGDFVFVSGQVPARDGEIVVGGIVEQTEQTMQNIIEVLALAGCTLEDVVKVNIWLDDPRDFTSFNGVFKKYFESAPPARSTVQSSLMVDAKIEMDVTAYRPV
jgi:reactive intermediate/imine deaminase